MTDSIRCTADSPNTFTCEVQLDADLEALSCDASEPELEPPAAPNPALSLLASRFVSRTLVPAPPAPLITGTALLECASSEASVVLAAVGASKNPYLGALAMLKASIDVSHCLMLARNEAAQRNAEDYCAAQGGVVIGVTDEKTICEVRETVK